MTARGDASSKLPKVSEKATCIALMLCDQVIDDKRSNNKSYIGAFNAIYAQVLPCVHPRACILASLTNLMGPHELTVSIKSPTDNKLFEAKMPIDLPDPLQVADFVFEIMGMPLSETGTYFVDVYCDNSHLASRRFQVLLPSPQITTGE